MNLRRAVPAALVLLAACSTGGAGRIVAPSTTAPPGGTAATTGPSSTTAAPAAETTTTTAPPSVVVAAAGDIACEPERAVAPRECQMAATAEVVAAANPVAVLTLGDNQYEDGAEEKFRRSYEASWGRFKAVTRPSPGNHEYGGGRASGYFAYFGEAAGPGEKGWYSFDVGGWHVVSLNSNCSLVGCNPGTPQNEWLRADLAASTARCTLAYWHHPRFSSGYHGDDASVGPLWELLQAAGAELVLAGHDHHYERFAPLSPEGAPAANGMRQFVVGTGGRSLYPTFLPRAGSEVRRASSFGALLLTLTPTSYSWRFAALPGDEFTDTGRGECR